MNSEDAATEIASLAQRIGDANGFTFPESEATAASSLRNPDGAWVYHFETDERWGFVTAGPETWVNTTYPGWGTLTLQPGHWAVFYRETLVGSVSTEGGRIKWYAPPVHDDFPSDLESAMYDAFTTELDAVLPSITLWVDPKGDSYPYLKGGDV